MIPLEYLRSLGIPSCKKKKKKERKKTTLLALLNSGKSYLKLSFSNSYKTSTCGLLCNIKGTCLKPVTHKWCSFFHSQII